MQKELRKCNGEDHEQEGGYDFWEFLKKWNTLTLEEKHKKYDKYTCHEINIFVYFKDPAYFESCVRPFIQNKIEKTFIDYFLLNDKEQVKHFLSPSRITQLNALEQSLLVLHLRENGQSDEAREVMLRLEAYNKLKTYDKKIFKRLFDTVLSSKQNGATQEPPEP